MLMSMIKGWKGNQCRWRHKIFQTNRWYKTYCTNTVWSLFSLRKEKPNLCLVSSKKYISGFGKIVADSVIYEKKVCEEVICRSHFKKYQLVNRLTLAQVMISWSRSSSSVSGSVLTAQILEPALILCLPLSLPLPCSCSLSLSQK